MLATVRGQRIPLTEDIDCTPQYPPSNTFILFTLIFSFIKIIISFFRIVLKMKREEGKKRKLRRKGRTTGHVVLIQTMGSTRTLGHYVHVYCYCLLICAKCQLFINY